VCCLDLTPRRLVSKLQTFRFRLVVPKRPEHTTDLRGANSQEKEDLVYTAPEHRMYITFFSIVVPNLLPPLLLLSSVYRSNLTEGGPGSSVGIATDYGLDGPGSNPGGDEIFRPSRPALGFTQPPAKWVPDLNATKRNFGNSPPRSKKKKFLATNNNETKPLKQNHAATWLQRTVSRSPVHHTASHRTCCKGSNLCSFCQPQHIQRKIHAATKHSTDGRKSSVGTATRYGWDGLGFESRWGVEIFRTRPDGPCGPPSLLYNGYRVFLGGVKAARAWR